MTVDDLDDINLGDATTAEATGGSNEVGMISYLSRLNYDYKGIYLLEGLFRRDGSSRFAKENRWANFAGISGGVRFSELSFDSACTQRIIGKAIISFSFPCPVIHSNMSLAFYLFMMTHTDIPTSSNAQSLYQLI